MTGLMIPTIHGDMDESLLQKNTGVIDNDNEKTEWVEYWKDGELVHRSVHVTLKEGLLVNLSTGEV